MSLASFLFVYLFVVVVGGGGGGGGGGSGGVFCFVLFVFVFVCLFFCLFWIFGGGVGVEEEWQISRVHYDKADRAIRKSKDYAYGMLL